MSALTIAFGGVAKGVLVLAGLVIVVLMALGGVPDLPSTRKGWLQLSLTLAVLFALVFAFLYFWPGSPI